MGRKKEEQEQTEDTGPFPRFAVEPVEETDDQREQRQLEEAYKKAEAASDRREKSAANAFDARTKQHIQSILQSVIDGKARYRSRGRKMTGADADAIVRNALATLNDGLPTQAKGMVQVAADTLIRDDNPNYAELGEFARMASIDIANQYSLDNAVDDDKRSVTDIVESIPRA